MKCMYLCMYLFMDEWIDEWMDGWIFLYMEVAKRLTKA